MLNHNWEENIEMSASIRPLHDRVVLERVEEEQTTPGGIVIPETAAEKPSRGKVVAVGDGKVLDNGETRQLAVKQGDEVLFGKYAGTEVKLNGQAYLVMREDDIMGVIDQ
jgi:chaperonin GroES